MLNYYIGWGKRQYLDNNAGMRGCIRYICDVSEDMGLGREGNDFLRRFQQLWAYHDEIETRSRDEISNSLRIVLTPHIQNTAHFIATRPTRGVWV